MISQLLPFWHKKKIMVAFTASPHEGLYVALYRRLLSFCLRVLLSLQTMERFRFRETGIFKAKPADLMQMFRVSIPFSFPCKNNIQDPSADSCWDWSQ